VVRYRPVEQVVAEIAQLRQRYRIETVAMMDDSLLSNKKHALEFCRQVKPLGVLWSAQGRVTQLDDETAAALADAGCVLLSFGVESGSPDILKKVNKCQTVEQIIRAFDICKRHRLRTLAHVMCNHPGETARDIELTRNMLCRIRPDELSFYVTTPYPGTQIYEKYFRACSRTFTKESYHLFTTTRLEVIEQFKLCEHNISVNEIFADYYRIVYLRKPPASVSFLVNPKYLFRVLASWSACAVFKATAWDLLLWLRYVLIESLPVNVRRSAKPLRDKLRIRCLKIFRVDKHPALAKFIDTIVGKSN
jgi:hypothetical protein